MRRLLFFLVSLVIISSSSAVCVSQGNREIYGEEQFRGNTEIPNGVIASLKKSWLAGCPSRRTEVEFSPDWFEAVRLDLNDDSYPDLLVKAKDPNECFNGNAISWWAFSGRPKGYRMVFYAYTLSFRVESRKTRGFFDLLTGRCTGNACLNTIFKFDGRKYRPRRSWWKPLDAQG